MCTATECCHKLGVEVGDAANLASGGLEQERVIRVVLRPSDQLRHRRVPHCLTIVQQR